ncbi:hypothetical protein T484DRAFT_3288823 [Baffinella frigidus]|nr:hypothetical protein T484DRAFT_3288823 [Cryptophyta sp. CCMP2293]
MVTVHGQVVTEQRGTAWLSDDPACSFPYSGKVMQPSAMTPGVAAIRDQLHTLLGVRFDGVLVNLYPEGSTHMRFHSDPDQGELWTSTTAVVSVGDTRVAFRDIADVTRRHTFHVRTGDVVVMFDDCQACFQHAILKEDKLQTGARISLVFKEAVSLRSSPQPLHLPA